MSKNCLMSGKQCRPWWDAAFCSVSSGSTLLAQALSVRINTVNTVIDVYALLRLQIATEPSAFSSWCLRLYVVYFDMSLMSLRNLTRGGRGGEGGGLGGVKPLELVSLGEAVLTSTHKLGFEQKYKKIFKIFIRKLSVFGGEIFSIFE